jgi:CheY-like chemotaxis protein
MTLSQTANETNGLPLEGRRILVVEDHGHTATLVKQTLLQAGAVEVLVVGDGEQALAARPLQVVADADTLPEGGAALAVAGSLRPNPGFGRRA